MMILMIPTRVGTNDWLHSVCFYQDLFVTYSGDTEQVGMTNFSEGINSAGHFYPIKSGHSYLEAVNLPFNN